MTYIKPEYKRLPDLLGAKVQVPICPSGYYPIETKDGSTVCVKGTPIKANPSAATSAHRPTYKPAEWHVHKPSFMGGYNLKDLPQRFEADIKSDKSKVCEHISHLIAKKEAEAEEYSQLREEAKSMGNSSDLYTIDLLYKAKEEELKALRGLQGRMCR